MTNDVLFVWIPKTAGTSLDHVFRHKWRGQRYGRKRYGGKPIEAFPNAGIACFGHYSIEALRDHGVVSQDYLDRAFVFAFVRNPWARIASFAAHAAWRHGYRGRQRPFMKCLDEYCQAIESRRMCRLGLYNACRGSTLQPQSKWLFDRDGAPIVPPRHVYRYEEFGPSWRDICRHAGQRQWKLPRLKSFPHPHYRECMTAWHHDVIEEWYADDIERYGYEF